MANNHNHINRITRYGVHQCQSFTSKCITMSIRRINSSRLCRAVYPPLVQFGPALDYDSKRDIISNEPCGSHVSQRSKAMLFLTSKEVKYSLMKVIAGNGIWNVHRVLWSWSQTCLNSRLWTIIHWQCDRIYFVLLIRIECLYRFFSHISAAGILFSHFRISVRDLYAFRYFYFPLSNRVLLYFSSRNSVEHDDIVLAL